MSSARVVSSVDHAVHLVGEGLFVRGFDQECGVARDLGNRAGAGRDDGDPRSHGFEHREAEALVDRRIGEQGRAFQERAPSGVGDRAGQDHAGAGRGGEARDRGVDLGPGRAVVARR